MGSSPVASTKKCRTPFGALHFFALRHCDGTWGTSYPLSKALVMPCRDEMSKRINFAFAVTECKDIRTLREKLPLKERIPLPAHFYLFLKSASRVLFFVGAGRGLEGNPNWTGVRARRQKGKEGRKGKGCLCWGRFGIAKISLPAQKILRSRDYSFFSERMHIQIIPLQKETLAGLDKFTPFWYNQKSKR